jgi:hypothetical protein
VEPRTKVLLIITVALAASWLGYTILWKPWNEKRTRLDEEIKKTKRQLSIAKEFLGRRSEIEGEWKRLEGDLRNPQRDLFTRGQDIHVRQLIDKVITDDKRRPNLDMKAQADQNGDFAEWIVDIKTARFKSDEFMKFLVALANAKDFLKVRSMNVSTQVEQEVIVADVRLSTIEYSPRAKP